MRILMIRHGDPDYEHDTLTEKGHREAALLAETADRLNLGTCYMSPLGRAQHTAAYSLQKTGKTAKVLDWLREFPVLVDINQSAELCSAYPDTPVENGKYRNRIAWDMVPSYLSAHTEYWTVDGWRNSEVARCSDMALVYDSLVKNLDEFLAEAGYVREGGHYRVEKESRETITFFCHFGVTCAILSHLWNVSPFVLWHSLALAPTSVTEVVTEEREQGIAGFRGLRVGDLSHLYAGGETPSFACRFCETYSDSSQRH